MSISPIAVSTPSHLAGTTDGSYADVLAAARGEVPAFERLVLAYQTLVCSIALGIVRDVEASEEVAQETFISVWKNLGKLKSPYSFRPWLKQLVRARAHDYLRQSIRVKNRTSWGSGTEAQVANAPSSALDARAHLIAQQELKTLEQGLELLPVDSAEALILYYREGNSVRQVASLLEISEPTARKRISRARNLLRAEVERSLGNTLRSTAPGASFTAAVLASLTFTVPGTAAAAALGLSAKSTGLVVVGWSLATLCVGMAGGIATVLFTMNRDLKYATDERERRTLKINTVASVIVVIAFGLFIAFSSTVHKHPPAAFALVIAYWLGLNTCIYFRNKITLPRRLELLQHDPEAMKRVQRRNVWAWIVSILTLVIVVGGLAILYTVLGRW